MEEKEDRLVLERKPNRIKQPPKILAHALLSLKQINVFQGGAVTQEGLMDRSMDHLQSRKGKMDQNQSQHMSLPGIKPVQASCAMGEVFPSLTGEGDWIYL